MNQNQSIKPFLLTGMARSGTTLLDKLLTNHPNLDVLSQPFPFIYRYLKEQFFYSIDYPPTYYVLNNLFNERQYDALSFQAFLQKFTIDKDAVIKQLEKMKNWSGQGTDISDPTHLLSSYQSGTLHQLYVYFLDQLKIGPEVKKVGSKEILIEEFIPYFLEAGIPVIQIFRDPRDVYTSLNYGKGPEYVGNHRPSLFHLRNWRKSVAIGLSVRNHPLYFSLKYEDLVGQTLPSLNAIAKFLGEAPFASNAFEKGIFTRKGQLWKGNSSTQTKGQVIDPSGVGKYKSYLPESVLHYIHYLCAPEMQFLGYEVDAIPMSYGPETFEEPFPIQTENLSPQMSTSPDELQWERRRIALINEKGEVSIDEDVKALFYHERTLQALREIQGNNR